MCLPKALIYGTILEGMQSDERPQLIDAEGFRHNVGIIVSNPDGKVFWARRIGRDVWQFPQGGMLEQESPEEAMYRELEEETGLRADHVRIVGATPQWLKYRLPKRMIRHDKQPLCIGQKQIWFMLQLTGGDQDVCLSVSSEPEFDHWRWVSYWHPLREVVFFKRRVYEQALDHFADLLRRDGITVQKRRRARAAAR